MRKAPLLIVIGIIALSIAGFFIYRTFFAGKKIHPWDLVPESAVVVYETSSCQDCIERTKNSSPWQIIQQAAFYQKKQDSIRNIIGFLAQPSVGSLVSMHVTKKDDFDFIFYIPVGETDRKLVDATIESWKQKKGIRYSEREFNKVQIQEIATTDCIFSWVQLTNVWVGSFTPFLVEDVIRAYSDREALTFKDKLQDVYQMPRLKNDAGNLYIQLRNFSDWLAVFAPDFKAGVLEGFGKGALLDIKAGEKNIVLNGFSIDDPQHASALSIFNDQSPTSFTLKQYVSNRTVMLTSYGINEGMLFGKKLSAFSGRNRTIQDSLVSLSRELKVNLSDLYRTIDNEVGVCYVESGGKELSKILLVETSEPESWMKMMNSMSEQLSADTVFFEPYSSYEIRELPLYQFPAKMFAPFVNGFDQCYYTSLGNTLIMGENLEQLKLFLEDIDREDTWGKSVVQNKFLESTLLESNISLYINTPRIWNVLGNSMNEKWSKFIEENRSLLAATGMGAIQFSHLNESFYTNVSWLSKQIQAGGTGKPEKAESVLVGFAQPLLSAPFVLKSHVDKSDEVLIQDSSYQLHMISPKGAVLWTLPLNGPVIGSIEQVDYFKNGKLQYFFATQGSLHIVDRLGSYVQSFPLKVSDNIEHVSLVDYDHSKNYRFMVADKSGKIWIYDKGGENLEGWTPKNVEDALFTAPQHHRIRGKDYIIAIRKDGKAYLMNRRGEMIKGFPLTLDARPTGDYFVETGNSLENTYFVVISRDGFRIKFNLLGQVQSRETLLKTTVDARFSLVKEHNGKSYVIVRQESKGLSILDIEGKEIVTNTFLGLNEAVVQYYDFGAGRVYYLITDLIQNLAYIYDAQGTLLVSPPVEAYSADLYFSAADKVKVYITYDKSLLIRPLL